MMELKNDFKRSKSQYTEALKQMHKHTHPSQPENNISIKKLPVEDLIDTIDSNHIQDLMTTKKQNNKMNQHTYYQGIPRTVKFASIGIPPIVKEFYEKERLKSQNVNFSQGVFQLSGYVYYAVQNYLILFKFQHLLTNDIESMHYSIIQIRNTLLSLKEINDKNKVFPLQENIVIMSHPWQLQLYSWTQDDEHPELKKLKKLQLIIDLELQSATHFDYSLNGTIYYFDNMGKVHQFIAQEDRKFFVMKTGRYSLKHYINNTHGISEVLKKKGGRFDLIMNLFRSAGAFLKNFYSFSIKTKGMFCDRRRKLLFGLLEKKTYTIMGREYKTFVVCYRVQNDEVQLLNSLSEEGLLEEAKSVCLSELKVKGIELVNLNENKRANLCLVLHSGDRLFYEVSSTGFKFRDYVESPQRKFNQFSQRLVSYHHDTDKFLAVFSNRHDHKSAYITQKIGHCSDSLEREHVTEIELEIMAQRTAEHSVYKIKQESCLDFFIKQPLKFKHRTHGINNLHELTEQVFRSPTYYLFLSNISLQYIAYLRPIDIVFTVLMIFEEGNPDACLQIFKNILFSQISEIGNNNVDGRELSSMLLQIIIDEYGKYYYSKEVVDSIFLIYKHKKENKKTISKKFGQYQNNQAIFKNLKKCMNSESKIYKFNKLKNKFLSQCFELFILVGQNHNSLPTKKSKEEEEFFDFDRQDMKNLNEKEIKSTKFIFESVLLYLSRITRIIWKQILGQIGLPQTTFLINRVKSIKQFTRQVEDRGSMVMKNTKILTKFKDLLNRFESILYAISRLPYLPEITFKQALLSDCTFLESYIFKSIELQLRSTVISEWKQLFPQYLSPDLIQLIRIFDQIQTVSDKKSILQILKTRNKKLPSYFVEYLTKIRKISEYEIIDFMMNSTQKIAFTISDSIKKCMKDKFLTVTQKVTRIKPELSQMTITQRYMMTGYLNQFMKIQQQKDKQYDELISCILIHYELFKIFSEKGKNLDPNIRKMLERQQFQTQELGKIVEEVDEIYIKIYYELSFRKSQKGTIFLLKKLFQSHFQSHESYHVLKQELQKQIKCLKLKLHGKFPLKEIILVLDEFFIQKISLISCTITEWLLFKKKALITSDIIWLPQFLIQIGFQSEKIMLTYYSHLDLFLNEKEPMKQQLVYFFKFICCFTLVRDFERDFTQQFCQKVRNQISSVDVQDEVRVGLYLMLSQLG